MSGLENEITLLAVALCGVVVLIQLLVVGLRRRKLDRDEALFRQVESGRCDEMCFSLLKQRLTPRSLRQTNSFSLCFLSQAFLDYVIAIGLAIWAVYLTSLELTNWSLITGACALIATVMPFALWHRIKENNKIKHQLIDEVAYYETLLKKQGAPVPLEDMESVIKSNVIPAPAPPKSAVTAVKPSQSKPWQPEDSILKRHYLAQQTAEQEARHCPYPTDSILRRHYQAMRQAQSERPTAIISPQTMVETVSATTTQTAAAVTTATATPATAPGLPEDSILKRHYLATLRAEIETALCYPQPTDSILRRHYEGLIASEITKRLQ